MTYTHAYAILKLSKAAYEEIKAKLEAAGYGDQIHSEVGKPEKPFIDMHGIAVVPE